MATKDINLYETGSGGDIAILANDIVLTDDIYQQVYLCLFGGNVEASTKGDEITGEPRLDYWQNSLFYEQSPAKQFNSSTEKALRENTINATGRIAILRAVESDLQSFKSIADISVNVVILSTNKISVSVQLSQPQNQQDKFLQFAWDSAKQELIVEKTI